MEEIVEAPFRLDKILEHSGLHSLSALAGSLGINKQILYDINKGKCGISKKLAQKIALYYPDLSFEWIYWGIGSQFADDSHFLTRQTRAIDRFDVYMASRGISDSKAQRDLGLSNGALGKARMPGKDIPDRTLCIIATKYPDVNMEWLTTGRGDMVLGERFPTPTGKKETDQHEEKQEYLPETDREQQHTVGDLFAHDLSSVMEEEYKKMCAENTDLRVEIIKLNQEINYLKKEISKLSKQ